MTPANFRAPAAKVNWTRRIADHLAANPPRPGDLELIETLARGEKLAAWPAISRAQLLLRGARNEYDIITYEGQIALIQALRNAASGPSPA